jgi:hypothetical protein
MQAYASGGGHKDLAQRLGFSHYESLAIGGSANSRILRTTIKHSYQQSDPVFYVLGMTFVSRLEIPILENQDNFEGRWTNPQNQRMQTHWQYGWSEQDTKNFVDVKVKSEIYSILDRVEDLMYRILSAIKDLQSRGHAVLVYQQADPLHLAYLDDARLALFRQTPEIIDRYAWRAVPWQLSQGVPPMHYGGAIHDVPEELRHPAPGYHTPLNDFLVDYIHQNNILAP